jgi:hypothetical protein
VNVIGIVLVSFFIALVMLTVAAAIRFHGQGGTSEDLLRSTEDVAKWYEITPGG